MSPTRNKLVECVVASLKKGKTPWRSNTGIPINPCTNKRYTGINSLVLDAIGIERNFHSKYWATYKQWQSLSLGICKCPNNFVGDWGTKVIRWESKSKLTDKGDILRFEKYNVSQLYVVFNAHQTFGSKIGSYIALNEQVSDYNQAETFVSSTGAHITHCKECECPKYLRPPEDKILLPIKERFIDDRQYMSTKLHELIHWSEWRTGWSGSIDQGELIAEMGAGYLEGELNLPRDTDLTNHNKWLSIWLDNIDKNPNYLLEAAAQMARATDYILSFV